MNYVKFKEILSEMRLISLSDIKKVDPKFHRRRLSEWQDKGYIKKILRGYYIFSDFELNEQRLYEIANKIYAPSYISLESALSYYGLIPESIYGITSISTRKTIHFKTTAGSFIYRTLQPKLFLGYELMTVDGERFKIASPEKALLDFFYLNTHIEDRHSFESLRINKERFFKIMRPRKLAYFLKIFHQKNLKKRVNSFWRLMQHA